MKDLENRGWEEMRKKLDIALPQKRNRFIGWWKLALPLLGLVAAVVAYLMVSDKSTRIDDTEVAAITAMNINNVPTTDNSAVSNLNTEEGKDEPENITDVANAGVEFENSKTLPENNSVLIEENNIQKANHTQQFKKKNNSNLVKSKSDQHSGYLAVNSTSTGGQNSNQLLDNQVNSTNFEEKALNGNDVNSVQTSNELTSRKANNNDLSLLNKVDIDQLEFKDLELNNQLLPVIKNVHSFNFFSLLLKGGAFTQLDGKYRGLTIMPELNYNIGKQSILFANAQVRYRRTKESVITRDFNSNVKEFFDSNNLYAPEEILISEQNVNVNSFDLGFDLGYRQRITKKLHIGAYGFARVNNIFDQSPVKNYKSEFSLVTNAALKDANTTYESSIDKFNYGAGIDLNYRLDNRNVVYAKIDRTFDHKKNYEVCLGYGFRLF